MRKLPVIAIPHYKHTAKSVPMEIPVPAEVRLPMSMHAGTPATPIVKVGEEVQVGQLIGESTGRVSSPIHASVSGTIKAIDTIDGFTGEQATSIVIASDGLQTRYSGQKPPPQVTNLEEFLEAVHNSGVVGLGGAGYPTAPKLTLREGTNLDYILINGAECEPYITSDTRAMVDRTEDVFAGAVYLKEYLKPKQVVLCVEDINKESIEKLSALCAGVAGIDVRVLPSKYPQGERKVLVYNVTGRVVPEGGRLTDVGCIVINCTTVAVFATYMRTGKPLVRRCVTVDGSAVKNPQNVLAPIGTPLRDLFAACGGLKDDVKKVLLGGPMMGAAVPSLDVPMVKITNAVLAFTEKDAFVPAPTACIKCGRCLSNCPMSLMPSYIEDAFERGNVELLKQYKVNLCAECGCCAYICPSKRPLSQVMTLSKNILWEAKQ